MATYQEYIYNKNQALEILDITKIFLENQLYILTGMRDLVTSAIGVSANDVEREALGTRFLTSAMSIDDSISATTYDTFEIFAKEGVINNISQYFRFAQQGLDVWSDDTDSLYGEYDDSGTHHINTQFFKKDSKQDEFYFNNGTALQAFGPEAPNYMTVQFGKQDCNGIFKKASASGNFVGIPLTGFNYSINPFTNTGTTPQINFWGVGTLSKLTSLLELLNNDTLSSGTTASIFDGTNTTGIPRIQHHINYINEKINFLRQVKNVSSVVGDIAVFKMRLPWGDE